MKAEVKLAEAVIERRKDRAKIFGSANFGEPAWDILLDLYVAQSNDVNISTSSLCIASGAPPTTALRWIGKLANEGWVERYTLPTDGRRSFLRLSNVAYNKMERLMTDWLLADEKFTRDHLNQTTPALSVQHCAETETRLAQRNPRPNRRLNPML